MEDMFQRMFVTKNQFRTYPLKKKENSVPKIKTPKCPIIERNANDNILTSRTQDSQTQNQTISSSQSSSKVFLTSF